MGEVIMKATFVIIVLLVLLGGSVYFFGKENARLKSDLAYYESTFLFKQGWTSFQDYGNYNLASFDGGLNWYAVERGEDRSVTILGPAEEIFPGLIKQQLGLEALFQHVKENGPIGSHPLTSEDIEALEGASFSVEEK